MDEDTEVLVHDLDERGVDLGRSRTDLREPLEVRIDPRLIVGKDVRLQKRVLLLQLRKLHFNSLIFHS